MKQIILVGFAAYIIYNNGTYVNTSTGAKGEKNSKGKITLKGDNGENKTFDFEKDILNAADLAANWQDVPAAAPDASTEENKPLTAEEIAALTGEEIDEYTAEEIAAFVVPLTAEQLKAHAEYKAEQAEQAKIAASIAKTKETNDAALKALQDTFNAAKKVRENETGEESIEVMTANRTAFLSAKKAVEDFKPEVNPYAETIKTDMENIQAQIDVLMGKKAKIQELYNLATGKKGGSKSDGTKREISAALTIEQATEIRIYAAANPTAKMSDICEKFGVKNATTLGHILNYINLQPTQGTHPAPTHNEFFPSGSSPLPYAEIWGKGGILHGQDNANKYRKFAAKSPVWQAKIKAVAANPTITAEALAKVVTDTETAIGKEKANAVA